MRLFKLTSFALVAAVGIASTPTIYVPEIDRDEDDVISWDEYSKTAAWAFMQADKDFDGSLTTPFENRQLHLAFMEADMVFQYRLADTDENGFMDEAEMIAMQRKRVESAMNSFGNVVVRPDADNPPSKEEMEAARKAQMEKAETEQARLKTIILKVSTDLDLCHPDLSSENPVMRTINFDCDMDGVVTLPETRRMMRIRFDTKDRNEDGEIHEDELPMMALFAF